VSISPVFLVCSACPSRAFGLIRLCFRLNEPSVEAGWQINSRICNKQSLLALPLMLSLRLALFLPRCSPQEGEKRDELLCLLASSSLLNCMHVLLHCHQKHKTSFCVQELVTPEKIFHHFCVPPPCVRNLDTAGFSFPFSSVLAFKPMPSHAQLIVFWYYDCILCPTWKSFGRSSASWSGPSPNTSRYSSWQMDELRDAFSH